MSLSLLNNTNQKDDEGENRVWFIPAFPSLLVLHSCVHTVSLLIHLPPVNKWNIKVLHSVAPAVKASVSVLPSRLPVSQRSQRRPPLLLAFHVSSLREPLLCFRWRCACFGSVSPGGSTTGGCHSALRGRSPEAGPAAPAVHSLHVGTSATPITGHPLSYPMLQQLCSTSFYKLHAY